MAEFEAGTKFRLKGELTVVGGSQGDNLTTRVFDEGNNIHWIYLNANMVEVTHPVVKEGQVWSYRYSSGQDPRKWVVVTRGDTLKFIRLNSLSMLTNELTPEDFFATYPNAKLES